MPSTTISILIKGKRTRDLTLSTNIFLGSCATFFHIYTTKIKPNTPLLDGSIIVDVYRQFCTSLTQGHVETRVPSDFFPKHLRNSTSHYSFALDGKIATLSIVLRSPLPRSQYFSCRAGQARRRYRWCRIMSTSALRAPASGGF